MHLGLLVVAGLDGDMMRLAPSLARLFGSLRILRLPYHGTESDSIGTLISTFAARLRRARTKLKGTPFRFGKASRSRKVCFLPPCGWDFCGCKLRNDGQGLTAFGIRSTVVSDFEAETALVHRSVYSTY